MMDVQVRSLTGVGRIESLSRKLAGSVVPSAQCFFTRRRSWALERSEAMISPTLSYDNGKRGLDSVRLETVVSAGPGLMFIECSISSLGQSETYNQDSPDSKSRIDKVSGYNFILIGVDVMSDGRRSGLLH